MTVDVYIRKKLMPTAATANIYTYNSYYLFLKKPISKPLTAITAPITINYNKL